MKLYSTRNTKISVNPKDAIIIGLSKDSGLFSPKKEDIIKNKFDIKNLINNTYQDTAKFIFKIFLDDFSDEEIDFCVKNAYNTNNFSTSLITPTTAIGKNYLLELYHGPTSAFKDVGLTMLPQFINCAYSKNSCSNHNQHNRIYILTATSGDTGKAALEGFKNVENISITVFYPADGVSDIQKLQMQTTEGENVSVYGITENFDACQKLVKDIYTDLDIDKLCKENNVVLSSANSMNIGRLIPQIVYYVQGYIDLVKQGEINIYDKVNFVVPTGNFGNILAGYIAKLLGLPINKLICSSNENDVLFEFINTGCYNKNRTFYKTIAPSIDILVSSNVERLLFWIFDNNDKLINEKYKKLQEEGIYNIDKVFLDKIQQDFIAYSSNEEECMKAMKESFYNDHRLIDTHTAIAYSCLQKYENEHPEDKSKNIILSTASPYKFVKSVLSALDNNVNVNDLNDFECITKLNEISKEPIPTNLANLKNKTKRFTDILTVEEAKSLVKNNIKEKHD